MSTSLKNSGNINYLWHNMKAVLIFTVVLGHFLETFPLNNIFASALDYWIYTFHMPAFLFISGYLSKSFCQNSRVRAEKITYYLSYYLVFQIIFFLLICLTDPGKDFSLFNPNIGLWYLISLAAYYAIIPLAEKVPPYIVMGILVFLGLMIGTEKEAGTLLTVSRTFVFAPFFFAGYYLPEKLLTKLQNFRLHILTGILCGLVSVAIWGSIVMIYSKHTLPMQVFYGKANYESMGFSDLKGISLRVIAWIISFLMVVSVLLLTTQKKTFFSYLGERSLQIYLFHFPLIILFKKTDITDAFPINNILHCIVLILGAIAFTFILSIKPLSYPFLWIKMLVDKCFVKFKGDK